MGHQSHPQDPPEGEHPRRPHPRPFTSLGVLAFPVQTAGRLCAFFLYFFCMAVGFTLLERRKEGLGGTDRTVFDFVKFLSTQRAAFFFSFRRVVLDLFPLWRMLRYSLRYLPVCLNERRV